MPALCDRNHALAFSDAVGPQGHVVAFEPQQFMMQVHMLRGCVPNPP